MSVGVRMPASRSRTGAGAVTTSAWTEFAARVDSPTAVSRATMRNLSAPAQPLPAFGAPEALPASASRAARSASAGSFLSRPAMRFSRLGLTTSAASYPSSASLLATPAPYDPVPSIPTTAQSPGSPIADAISPYPAASALYVPVLRTRPTRSITQRACVSLCVSRPAATVPFSFMRLPSLPQVPGGLRSGQTRR